MSRAAPSLSIRATLIGIAVVAVVYVLALTFEIGAVLGLRTRRGHQ